MQEKILRIDLQKLRQNALAFKRLTDRFVYAVVKADGYGHGAIAVASALYPVADGFAVALVREGIQLRTAACGKEILVFTPPATEDETLLAARNGLTLTVGDLRSARRIAQTAKKYGLNVRAQVKINTGMNRYGTYGATLGKVCKILKESGQVRVEGVYSHLYSHDKALCEGQRIRFCHDVKIVRKYFPLARAHLAATYGVGLGKEYYFDAVRIGLGLYGYFPCGESPVEIQPVMKAYAPCAAEREYRFGGMGYGGERSDLLGKTVSVLRAGYADGLGVSGERCGLLPKITSEICMDVCFAAGERKPARQVLLFDDAAAVANERGSSVYEILCLAALRSQRIYYG